MTTFHKDRERGAILVQAAILLVVLLLFVGLAIDVGALYGERRHMQNAADAGALAGARAICFGGDPVLQATEYAVTRNGAADALVEIVDEYQVRVTATYPTTMHFATLIGLNTVEVSAQATAACGSASAACGLWPLAVSIDAWYANCGTEFIVWDDNKISCDVYNCDRNGDGFPDVMVGGARGWLDFSSVPIEPPYTNNCKGGGAALIKCLLQEDFAPRVSLPACICSKEGVNASAWKVAGEQAGRYVKIPLFDSISTCQAPGCGGKISYHIVDYGCAEVVGNFNREIVTKDGKTKKNAKVLVALIDCQCATNCSGTTVEDSNPRFVRAVSLVR